MTLRRGTTPPLISLPHVGTGIPESLRPLFVIDPERAQRLLPVLRDLLLAALDWKPDA